MDAREPGDIHRPFKKVLGAQRRALADRGQIQQVVLNLVMNAIQAMSGTPAGLRRLTIASGQPDDTTVRVSVRDQGSGVSAEQLEHLFEAFYSTKPNGLGMGLAISRGIVQAHHGRLWAMSNADRGTTLQFTLPVSASTES
jgi:signal transduction histidine kinase